jgi:hypothetical protein
VVSLYLKILHKQKSEKLLQKLVKTHFSLLLYKIALKLKLQQKMLVLQEFCFGLIYRVIIFLGVDKQIELDSRIRRNVPNK